MKKREAELEKEVAELLKKAQEKDDEEDVLYDKGVKFREKSRR